MSGYKHVVCKDGFKMSVQAGSHAYCNPREDVGPYYEVEVGYPNQIESFLLPYIECPVWEDPDGFGGSPTKQVYPYVPVGVIRQVIEKHGGMVEGDLPLGVELVCDPVLEVREELAKLKAELRAQEALLRETLDAILRRTPQPTRRHTPVNKEEVR